MGSPSLYSARKTTLALAVALSFAWQAPVFAHGGEAHMVPMCSGTTTPSSLP
ncbi:hypothetical protein HVV36_12495 [Escherichia coli]|nr:hypothetical protein HVV36_12495 [Escherichia coli]QMR35595.1 hypothetical protein HVV31_12495 [Escherichia coli]